MIVFRPVCAWWTADAQNDTAKLAISIARKMNALIFLVPEDIVDVRPRLVRLSFLPRARESDSSFFSATDFNVYWKPDEHCALG